METTIWQDFGQKVTLTGRIREILINYPEGTSVLKELIQVSEQFTRIRIVSLWCSLKSWWLKCMIGQGRHQNLQFQGKYRDVSPVLQNADDAGATAIKFCLDVRPHGRGRLSPADYRIRFSFSP